MPALFKNNATATIAASITNVDTTIVLSAGLGSSFPLPTGGDYFYATVFDTVGNYEIVKVTARATDTLTIVRAQDGTNPQAFNAGSGFAMRPVAAIFNNFVQLDGAQTITGTKTFTGNISASTATFSGAISSVSPTFTGTPTAPTAVAGTNTTQIATTAFVLANGVPSGAIMLWSGSIVSVPSGWYLCDGTNGTPDLRSRFIVGAGSTYAVGATGGSADATLVSHSHTATSTVSDPGHNHSSTGNGAPNGVGAGVALTSENDGGYAVTTSFTGITVSTSVSSSGSSGTNANLPPYYALAYIMKV